MLPFIRLVIFTDWYEWNSSIRWILNWGLRLQKVILVRYVIRREKVVFFKNIMKQIFEAKFKIINNIVRLIKHDQRIVIKKCKNC